LIFIYFLYLISADSIGVDEISNNFFDQIILDWKSVMDNITNIDVFGSILYTHYAPFLLIIGIILLISMIGAVILTKTSILVILSITDFQSKIIWSKKLLLISSTPILSALIKYKKYINIKPKKDPIGKECIISLLKFRGSYSIIFIYCNDA
jgi:hypothetical protein